MSNKSYFSQYESPNIVIIPTMSCNPSSPKRCRKIGNNIIVPIVNNATCEKQKLKLTQDNKLDDLNSDKKVDNNENSSKSPPGKASWASNYLQSIGLDKKSSIWNRKIPRKTASQTRVITVESPTITTPEVTPSSTCASKTDIAKSNQLKIIKKNLTDANTSKDSNTKIKNITTKDRNIKDKFKKGNQSEYKLTKSVSVKDPSAIKNKNIQNDPNKIKKEKSVNSKKNESHQEPNKLCNSERRSLHTKSGRVRKSTSQKDRNSKRSIKTSLVRHGQKSKILVEKSDIKSEITKEKKTKSDSAKPSSSYSTSTYKEKNKNPKCSMGNNTSMKNVKVTKKYDIRDFEELAVLKKAQYNTELKTRDGRNKADISKKTKTKEKLTQNKPDLNIKKIIKSPIKRKISETKSYREIKLVINLICNNQPTALQCVESSSNESHSGSTTCTTVPNIDLDFLNDFDIDEIVESLDTCEKKTSQYVQSEQELNKCHSKGNIDRHCVTSNVHTGYNNTTDAIDLIKTLKGEEDDDLMRISIENAKELQFSNNLDTVPKSQKKSPILDNLSKSCNSTFPKDASTLFVKLKEEEPEIGTEGAETVSCNAAANLKNEVLTKRAGPNHVEITVNKSSSAKETQRTILRRKTEESKGDDSLSPSDSNRAATSRTLSIELDDNKNKSNIKVNEQDNVNPVVCNIDSFSVFNEVNTDSYKTLKLHEKKTENKNQEKCECVTIHKNKFTKLDDNLLDQQNATNLHHENEMKTGSSFTNNPSKVSSTANVNIIVDTNNKNSNYTEISNTLKFEINNKDINDSTNDTEQKDTAASTAYSRKQEENNTGYIHDKCIKAIKDLSNNVNGALSNNQNKDKANNSVTQEKVLQHNNSDTNSAENNEDQKNLTLTKNIVKEENKIPHEIVQIDKYKDGTEEHYVEKDFNENKQKEFSDNNNEIMEPQEKISDGDENTRGHIKCKVDIESVSKLEERLFTNSGSKYSIIANIHTGKFSKIFKCKHPNGKYYALKMPTRNIKYNLGKEKKQMLNSLVSDIPKNNLFIVCLTKAFNVGEKWCFLMEYYPKNLDQALSEAGKPFSIEQIQDYARQLVMAVMVLKNKNMVHLDIKPKHILLNSANNMLKLCGFDSLCYINKMRILPNIGTVNYRAPEVILGYKSGFEIDVWATGLVLYEMAANKKLFPGMYNNDILYKQICTLGCVPYDMIKKSGFGAVHFMGSKFMRKSGFKGQNVSMISKFYKNNKLCDSIYEAYFENWSHHRNSTQQNCDIGKLSLFVKLLQKMLTVHPEYRLPIEFVYANPFIYDAYSYQEW